MSGPDRLISASAETVRPCGHSLKGVIRRANKALAQSRCSPAKVGLRWHNEAGTEQIKPSAAIHLALHQLEFGDLAFRLSIGPGLTDSGGNGLFVSDDKFLQMMQANCHQAVR